MFRPRKLRLDKGLDMMGKGLLIPRAWGWMFSEATKLGPALLR
jgi:hypothetical protein